MIVNVIIMFLLIKTFKVQLKFNECCINFCSLYVQIIIIKIAHLVRISYEAKTYENDRSLLF